jgi:error-prone DNA polymerase
MVAGATTHLATRPPPYYVELHAHSDHSLLDGISSPEALAERAVELGMPALALTDHDNLYGAVRFVHAAREVGIKPILGAEITLDSGSTRLTRAGSTRLTRAGPMGPASAGLAAPPEEGFHLTLLVESGVGYTNLCRLITLARRGQEKGVARLTKGELAAHAEGLIALSGCRWGEIPRLVAAGATGEALQAAWGYARLFGPGRFFIELQRHHRQGDIRLLGKLLSLAKHAGLGVVATGNVHYVAPEQREVHDVLTCIRHHITLEEAGRAQLLRPNAEYLMRSPAEMAALFPNQPKALANTVQIAERCADAGELLPAGPQALPRFPVPGGRSPYLYLRALCLKQLQNRYPVSPPHELLEKELAIIEQLKLADYFLVVWDIVHSAHRAGIRCQGRGSAANSLVAYLLGITPIDPISSGLVFERFLSAERAKTPDIDIDFAANRREEVIQYVYRRYGTEHAAMACTLVTFRTRSAVRDTARALGFPPALVERLAVRLNVRSARNADDIRESLDLTGAFGEEPLADAGRDPAQDPLQHLLRIAPQLEGKPRHLGIHNGGMVLSGPPLADLVPLEPASMPDRVVTQWDKEGLEGTGMVKIDILGLRMLAAIEDTVAIVQAQTGTRPELEALALDDSEVYEMLCRGEAIGVFQVESRAQANLIPQFQPHCFADLVIQISLIRPGPIQANMVHPYLRRRRGVERITYPHPLMEPALKETLGVIVFQEQVIKVARDLAGFTPGRAELLRRALGHKRAGERLARFRQEFLDGCQAQGVPFPVARQVWLQLEAFGGYAFAKSHAAAFAVLTYQSAWLRRYHPAAFFAALLRHQPMGFYPPHVIVSEARRCGVEIRPVDITASELLASIEDGALRLGLAAVGGLGETAGANIIEARQVGPFRSLADFCRRTQLGRRLVEALIWAGAFDSWGVPRRQLLWDLQAALQAGRITSQHALPLEPDREPRFNLLSPLERLWAEVTQMGMSANGHLTDLVSDQLREMGVSASITLPDLANGCRVWIGGVVVSAQRPPTAGGTAFLAVEDRWGLVNVVLRPEIHEESRSLMRTTPFVVVEGQLQKQNGAISVLAHKVIPLKMSLDGRSRP